MARKLAMHRPVWKTEEKALRVCGESKDFSSLAPEPGPGLTEFESGICSTAVSNDAWKLKSLMVAYK